jgi:transcriptional regulator with XRE-family HTH domain
VEKSIYTKQYGVLLVTLREAREAAGLSQIDLALRLGTTQSIVSKCELGRRRLDVIELREWCHALGLPLAQFALELESAIQGAGPD